MENFLELIKLTIGFFKEYFKPYLKLMIVPIVFLIIGVLTMLPMKISPWFSLLALFISLPCFCYAFWRAYLIAYSLNYAAYEFIKGDEVKSDLYGLLQKTKEKGNKIALYTVFISLVTLLLCLPVLIYFGFQIKFCIDYSILSRTALNKFIICTSLLLINLILLLPFTNFALQAFFFKKKEETFVDLFKNCYKRLNFTGVLVATFNFVISCLLTILPFFCYMIFIIFFVLFSYPINAFWYYQRCISESKQ